MGAQSHFDPLFGRVPEGHVVERGQIEIGVEVGVDDGQYVPIERGGDARAVVVGGDETWRDP
jgi:hypothetical protein